MKKNETREAAKQVKASHKKLDKATRADVYHSLIAFDPKYKIVNVAEQDFDFIKQSVPAIGNLDIKEVNDKLVRARSFLKTSTDIFSRNVKDYNEEELFNHQLGCLFATIMQEDTISLPDIKFVKHKNANEALPADKRYSANVKLKKRMVKAGRKFYMRNYTHFS